MIDADELKSLAYNYAIYKKPSVVLTVEGKSSVGYWDHEAIKSTFMSAYEAGFSAAREQGIGPDTEKLQAEIKRLETRLGKAFNALSWDE